MSTPPLHSWPSTRLAERFALTYPIVQGPFGGSSTVELVAAVSNGGGLGSFGANQLEPEAIVATVDAIRERTDEPFAINLWVSTHDEPEQAMTPERFAEHAARLAPYYDELGVAEPTHPGRFAPSFDEQVEALLDARPPVFSFVFGVPDASLLQACRKRGIKTIGTATTPDEAKRLDDAGVDAIVASGFEAGGHRGAFLDRPEHGLTGTFALIPTIADRVTAPLIAAGGIADARGIVAALALGAHGVQIGSAFLATTQSGAPRLHRELLHSERARHTTLTRSFTGRLARGIRNRLAEELTPEQVAPYPVQRRLVAPLREHAELFPLWAGQAAPLIHEHDAAALLQRLTRETDALLNR